MIQRGILFPPELFSRINGKSFGFCLVYNRSCVYIYGKCCNRLPILSQIGIHMILQVIRVNSVIQITNLLMDDSVSNLFSGWSFITMQMLAVAV